jgi:exosortase/archaeosortase
MNLFRSPAGWYWALSVAVSLYQAWRGGVMQHQFAKRQAEQDGWAIATSTPIQLFFARTLADAITYLISALTGFACLLLAYRLLSNIPSADKISGGSATALIFFVVFGILGITGKLPDVYLHLAGKAFKF